MPKAVPTSELVEEIERLKMKYNKLRYYVLQLELGGWSDVVIRRFLQMFILPEFDREV